MDVAEQRVRFMVEASQGEKPMSTLCSAYGISRPTGYLWLKRYRQDGLAALPSIAAVHWIENGELTYPVQEITIAGNLKDMFRNITAIGNDLVFRGSVASPTLRIDGMTVAGE
jgi:predicted Zn-dependent protease